jgi:hypothetical protein
MPDEHRCDQTLTLKADGPEPYRCTLPFWHSSGHRLVQESTGKTQALTNPCGGGRYCFLRQPI